MYYLRSRDKGATWGQPRKLLSGTYGFGVERPQIAADGNSVHIVAWDDRDGRPKCFTVSRCPETHHIRSLDGGTTWSEPTRLTNSARGTMGGRADVAIPSPGIVVVGYDYDKPGDTDQYIQRSTDNGATWSSRIRLTSTEGALSTHNSIVARDGIAHIAWHDERRSNSSPDIYYRVSLDGGATWEPEERVNSSRGALTPLLALSDNYIHIVWLDKPGPYRRYARRPLPSSTGGGSSPAPTLDFSADSTSIREGESVSLSWEATEAQECTASGDWSGRKSVSGSERVSPQRDAVYTLSCTGAGGEVSERVSIAVRAEDSSSGGDRVGPCHLVSSGASMPSGFGAPYDTLTASQPLLMTAHCAADNTVEISVGDGADTRYIYASGHTWRFDRWNEFAFEGTQRTGDWLIGSASITLSRSEAELRQPNFFVAYICTWTGQQWKCGCRDQTCAQSSWQLQAFQSS